MAVNDNKVEVTLLANAKAYDQVMANAMGVNTRYGKSAKKDVVDANTRLTRSFNSAASGINAIGNPVADITGRFSGLTTSIRGTGAAFGVAGVAVAGFTAALKSGLDVFEATEMQMARTEGLIRATGGAAGFTAEQMERMARDVALNTMASTDGIRSAQSVLMTFRSVSGETFEESIRLSQDMASVMGTDVKSAAMQLGKALEDPVAGLSALTRSGISFSETEKLMVRDMMAANKAAEAQAIVLAKINGQIGGTASAEADGTLGGSKDTLGQKWNEFLESLARTSMIAGPTKAALDILSEGLNDVRENLDISDIKNRLGKDEPIDPTIMGLWRDEEIEQARQDLENQYKVIERQLEISTASLDEKKALTKNPRQAGSSQAYGALINQIQQDEKALKAQQESLLRLQADLDRLQQEVIEPREQERFEAAEKGRKAQEKLDEQRRKDALKKQQEISAGVLSTLQIQLDTEEQKLSDAYQNRKQQISDLVLSEAQVKQAGFESEQELRDHYHQLNKEQFDLQREEMLQKKMEADQKELDATQAKLEAELEAQKGFWEKYADSARKNLTDIDNLTAKTLERFSANVGDAFADAIVDGKNFGSVMNDVARGIAKSMISSLVEIGVQRMVLWGIEKAIGVSAGANNLTRVTSEAGSAVALAGANAFASTAAIPIIGPAMAPAAAAAATAAATPFATAAISAASTGLTGMAHSGIDNIPTEGTWLLDKGERVLSPKQNADLTQYLESQKGNSSANGPAWKVIIHEAPPGTTATIDEQSHTVAIAVGQAERNFVEQMDRGGPMADAYERNYGGNRGALL